MRHTEGGGLVPAGPTSAGLCSHTDSPTLSAASSLGLRTAPRPPRRARETSREFQASTGYRATLGQLPHPGRPSEPGGRRRSLHNSHGQRRRTGAPARGSPSAAAASPAPSSRRAAGTPRARHPEAER